MTLSADDLALFSRLVREGIDNAILGGLAVPVKRPATTLFDIAGGAAGLVLMDGDTNGIQATNITGSTLAATARVLVEITPAGAVWITNALGGGGWQDYTPVVTQGVEVAVTVNYARWVQQGKTVDVQLEVEATGAGTASQTIQISVPLPFKSSLPFVGVGSVYDASAATHRYGFVRSATSTTVWMSDVNVSSGQVIGQSGVTLASGDAVALGCSYETT